MIRVLFVCCGNICRSPMAEYIMKYKVKNIADAEIASAATSTYEIGNDIYPEAKNKLREKGIPFEKRAARRIKKEDYEYYDMIVGMDEQNIRDMKRFFNGDPENKISLLLPTSVSDPWYTGDFEKAYQDIEKGVSNLIEKNCKTYTR